MAQGMWSALGHGWLRHGGRALERLLSRCANNNSGHGRRVAIPAAQTVASTGHKVMLVESPTKAKKIQKYLGDEYKVRM
jgi:reverse gyrase